MIGKFNECFEEKLCVSVNNDPENFDRLLIFKESYIINNKYIIA